MNGRGVNSCHASVSVILHSYKIGLFPVLKIPSAARAPHKTSTANMHSHLFSLTFVAVFLQQILFTAAQPLFNRDDGEYSTRTVFQFPNGSWVENIAVRANGNLLLTRIDAPELFIIDPSAANPKAQLVYSFPEATGLAGIAETSPDKFALIAGNFSFATGAQLGSWSIWTVDFSKTSCTCNGTVGPEITKVTNISSAKFLNGMSSLNNDTVLVGDIDEGVIYGVNVNTGSSYVASAGDPLLAPTPNPILGNVSVNGIHVRDNFLYFVTSATNIFGRMPIRADGAQIGNASIVAHAFNSSIGFDDFTFDDKGNFFLVTASGNSIQQVTPDGRSKIVAGSLNSTALAEPTSVHFGRGQADKNVLYVTTAGGLAIPVQPGSQRVGGQVIAVDMSKGAS